MRKNDNFTYFNMSILCIWLQVINEVKVTHKGQGHIKVKVKYLYPFKFYVAHTFCKQVICIRLNAFLFKMHEHRLYKTRMHPAGCVPPASVAIT